MGSLPGKLEGKFQRRPFPVLELHSGEQYRFRLWGDRVERGQFDISQNSGLIFIGRTLNAETKETIWVRRRWTRHSALQTFCPRCLDSLTRRARATLGTTAIFWPILSLKSERPYKIKCMKDNWNNGSVWERLYMYIMNLHHIRLWKHWHKINNYL